MYRVTSTTMNASKVRLHYNPLTELYAVLVDDEAYEVNLSHSDALALRASLKEDWTLLKHEED